MGLPSGTVLDSMSKKARGCGARSDSSMDQGGFAWIKISPTALTSTVEAR